jgi:UDP-N-acetyl-D-galactosamine dehydrogenase
MDFGNIKIGIIGLGYVGLPLAVEFGKKFPVMGFDINVERVANLKDGIDKTLETNKEEIENSKYLNFTSEISEIKDCNVFIVTVPTPINQFKSPDLTPLLMATRMIGKILKPKDIVIYESTVYPGCTEEDCVPVLEENSNLVYNSDFFCGYSPERINPGDKVNTLTTIRKVTSGSTPEIADFVDDLYGSIIKAGTFKAASLKVAEASKAIENAQRDVNISFVNELALIFDKIGIDTQDVLEAAGTKWNFLKYQPGLVGGHCIGVDPYYLAHKAESLGYHPQVILSGRRVNDNMGMFVANKLVKLMIEKGHQIKGANVLILGITFKENCPDIRNTKVVDIYNELKQFKINVDIYDPYASFDDVKHEYGINILSKVDDIKYDGIILAVAHEQFKYEIDFLKYKTSGAIIFDTKSFIMRDLIDGRL